ncbi:MAG: ATP-binding cassette domain-containing protein [Candidatus Izemoplasma sp.]|nr:ATP-binding cassette domain-containing protein [Candidatus Izemoplasma sp.]
MTLSQIKGFTIKFKQATVTVPDIPLKKQVTVLVGPNGVGKSTVLRVLAGMTSLRGLTGSFRYAQDHPKFPIDIVCEDLLTQINYMDVTFNPSLMDELIDMLQFRPYLKHTCTALSKGNQMKLNLILTLACEVDMYLLDEPFSGLDKLGKIALIDFMQKVNKQIIISSHLDDVIKEDIMDVVFL